MSILTILAIVLSTLLLVFSASQIGLSSVPLSYISQHKNYPSNTFAFYPPSGETWTFWFLPVNVGTLERSYALQLATGALGIVFGAVIVGIACTKPFKLSLTGRRAPRTFAWPIISFYLCTLLSCLALASLVVSFYDSNKYGSKSFHMSACVGEQGQSSTCYNADYDILTTIEGWTCGYVDSVYNLDATSNDAGEIVPRTCEVSMLARYWTIPLLILPILIILLAFLEVRRRNLEKYDRQISAGLGNKESMSDSSTSSHHPNTDQGTPSSPSELMSPLGALPAYSPSTSQLRGNAAEAHGKPLSEAPEAGHGHGVGEMASDKHQMYSELSAAKSTEVMKQSQT